MKNRNVLGISTAARDNKPIIMREKLLFYHTTISNLLGWLQTFLTVFNS